MIDHNKAKDEIKQLIDKYLRIKDSNKIKEYNEERTKKDFIEPLFEALGWDMRNKDHEDEVTMEEKVSKGRVDYAFRIKGIPKFFLEAKALKVDLDIPKWAEQATNYAWHKGIVWAVLSDFEGIKVFNAEWKTKGPLDNLFFEIKYNEYIDRIDQLLLLSKEKIENGDIDNEAERWGKKIKKSPVDEQILEDLMRWRTLLSKDIMKNPQRRFISADDLDEVVQRIIDRLIFIRTCEDRDIEQKILISILREWKSDNKKKIYKMLNETFREFDDKYNSNLFLEHFCEQLIFGNNVLAEIIEGLYRTKDENIYYDFSAIDADVLGSIYEQYLAHILKKSEKRAKITKKNHYRKEKGIYYTPTYIVEYIVKNTIDEYLKNKKISPEKIRILDPACGSGSFLIKAFDYLNDYFIKKAGKQTELSFARQSSILTNNIFGVDVDAKACEITRLNLLLKTTEKRSRLPTLNQNIKCGNSLIEDINIIEDKAFEWGEEFKRIMDDGGFDIIVGNPPYISNWQLSETDRNIVEYLDKKYSDVTVGHWDIYIIFIKRALDLLKDGGVFSFIVPSSFSKEKYGKKLRELIINNYSIISLAEFGTESVFKDVARQYIVFIIQKKKNKKRKTNIIHFKDFKFEKTRSISQNIFSNLHNFTFRTDLDDAQFSILKKISKSDCFIGNTCCVNVGVVAHSRDGAPIKFKKNDVIHDEYKEGYKKYIEGKNISRYSYSWKGKYMDYDNNAEYFHRPKFQKLFENKKIIARRVSGANNSIISVYDEEHLYMNDNLINIIPWDDEILKFQTPDKKWNLFQPYNYFSLKYIIGILNSKLITFYFSKMIATGTLQGTYTGVYPEDIRLVPIKKVPKQQQQPLIENVDKNLILNKRLNEIKDTKTDEERRIEDEIKRTDKEIDDIVFNLYNINEKEKKIIETSIP